MAGKRIIKTVRVTKKRAAYVYKPSGKVTISESYSVSIPKPIAEEYGIKGGETLNVTVAEVNIEGRKVKAIIYYRPS